MSITRKPKGKPSASEAQASALTEEGGRTARQETAARAVSLRIPGPLAERLDDFLQGQLVRVPRHAWILQAILEKLERSEKGGPHP